MMRRGCATLARARAMTAEGIPSPLVNRPVVSAKGSYLYLAPDETPVLDFTSGIGVTNTGHCHPKVVQAAKKQLDKLIHSQVSVAVHSPMVQLTNRLIDNILPSSHDRLVFSTTGAEAVENAMRLARAATKRSNIIVVQGGYHGRSVGTLALTRSKTAYGVLNQPTMSGVYVAPFPYSSQSPSLDVAGALFQLELLLKQQSAPQDTAAVLLEPVLGEGGYVPSPPGYLEGVRDICDKYNLVLILDEVQSGVGRTGKMWAHQWAAGDLQPDILIAAKGIGSGLPLSLVSSRSDLTCHLPPGTLGGTYAGNAIACAAALATLDVIEEENLIENANLRGEELMFGLKRISESHPLLVREVRGRGLMVGFELNAPKGSAQRLSAACAERGLLLLTASVFEVIRFIPSLAVTSGEIDEALRVFGSALDQVAKEICSKH